MGLIKLKKEWKTGGCEISLSLTCTHTEWNDEKRSHPEEDCRRECIQK